MVPKELIPTSCEPSCDPVMACPVCGGEHTHPVRLTCRSPGTAKGLVVIDSDGLSIDPRVPPQDRGVSIELTFVCEQSHLFQYRLHFHKGNTFVTRRTRHLLGDVMDRPSVIWRS